MNKKKIYICYVDCQFKKFNKYVAYHKKSMNKYVYKYCKKIIKDICKRCKFYRIFDEDIKYCAKYLTKKSPK